MSVARKLERRLEKLLDTTGKMFSGRLHPSEIAGKLAREADLARFEHESGPATANRYTISLNPADLEIDPEEIAARLSEQLDRHAAEEGLRLEGPLTVTVETSDDVAAGDFLCHLEVEPGAQVPWARLVGETASFEIGRNRAIVGRSTTADTVVPYEDISRQHVLIWRESGQAWIRDLGSANGTTADHRRVSTDGVQLNEDSAITLSRHQFRFEVSSA